MKARIARRVLIGAALIAGSLGAVTITCPIDNSMMMWTGRTRTEWGKMLYEYKCLQGHRSWVVK